ncbi:hypothetical protein [Paracoccus sp. SY]|uniref:hypothetical protein n=1 Tax=Paracoccus sp. SY TaxID=1330255 RepID=UPI000CD319C9|nr:hypothetical protein [Paracoccus sp. SY]
MTVYRQRLSALGWFGALLFIAGPAVIGWQLTEVLTFSGYGEPEKVGLFLASLMPALGAVLLLIGREYYDATDQVAKEQDASTAPPNAPRERQVRRY